MLRDVDLSTLQKELGAEGETAQLDQVEAASWPVHGVCPRMVHVPATAEALASALARCDRAGAAVIPWGGGTQQKLGLRPRCADVVLTTRRLNRLLEYEPADLTVTVEAGMRFADLQTLLAERGQWLPLDPMVEKGATIGGLIATNVSGPRRVKDGGLRDMVIGTRVANVDGSVTRAGGRVVKNVTGYDLNKLHIGALGTVGVIVEATFKVAPRPEAERSWVGIFATPEAAGRMAISLLRRPLAASALDVLNGRAASEFGISIPHGRWVLLGRASGFHLTVERHLAEFEAAARECGALETWPIEEDAGAAVWSSYAQKCADLRWSAEALTCRFAAAHAAVGPICRQVGGLGDEPVIWSHSGGAVFWSVAADAPSVDGGTVAKLRESAAAVGGSVVIENWPGWMAGVDVWGPAGGPVALMRSVKAQYDPRGVLNPGRFVGGI